MVFEQSFVPTALPVFRAWGIVLRWTWLLVFISNYFKLKPVLHCLPWFTFHLKPTQLLAVSFWTQMLHIWALIELVFGAVPGLSAHGPICTCLLCLNVVLVGFVWHICSLSWIKVVSIPQQSLTISSSTWLKTTVPACIRENLRIFQGLLAQKASWWWHICKSYSRAMLRSQLRNCMVLSAQMVLKAS